MQLFTISQVGVKWSQDQLEIKILMYIKSYVS